MYFFNQNDIESTTEPNKQAYLAILNEDLDSAYKLFNIVDSSRGRWGKTLIEILKGELKDYPTYFEIRNFYEIDLDFLIKNEKINYIEYMLGVTELLTEINQEIYKYAARALFANQLDTIAIEYLTKSKNILYKDPEMHFLFAKYYLQKTEYMKADFYIKECLKIVPDYFPAKKIHEIILCNLEE